MQSNAETNLFPQFSDFWDAYNKKVGRKKTKELWNRLSHKDKMVVMEHLIDYIPSTPDRQYRKNPETYLRNECFYDEIIAKGPAKTADAFQYFQQHYSGRN